MILKDSVIFKSLLTPQLRRLQGLFQENGHELRIAGGAVRDILMGIQPADVDFASTATPTDMIAIFEKHNIRMLHKRGEEHGTVTCRIDQENFEITTLRIDVVCDGRRAEVKFTENWELDANRRDLTINSLFLDLDGTVIDYTGGVDDVNNRRVAFVGDPVKRIQEDYLRILRYFRFFGRIARENSVHDEATIEAIIANKDGLKAVSPERIWTELKRIVIGRQAPAVLRTMLKECDLSSILGLPDSSASVGSLQRFEEIFENGMEMAVKLPIKLESMTMIASLCEKPEELAEFHTKTKLSNVERELGEFILREREEAGRIGVDTGDKSARYWRELLALQFGPFSAGRQEASVEDARQRMRVVQLTIAVSAPEEHVEAAYSFWPPPFPVAGTDLMTAKVESGPKMAVTKRFLFEMWVKSDFQLNKGQLLAHAHSSLIPQPEKAEKSRRGRKRKTSAAD